MARGIRILGLLHRERRAEVRLLCECDGEFGVGGVGNDIGNIAFNWMIKGESGVQKNWEV